MTKEKKDTSGEELIEALLEKYGRSREAILGENGLLAALKKRVVEKALAGELTYHLGLSCSKHQLSNRQVAALLLHLSVKQGTLGPCSDRSSTDSGRYASLGGFRGNKLSIQREQPPISLRKTATD